nr:hypothetical protein [Tanacetum cinerariifolium]
CCNRVYEAHIREESKKPGYIRHGCKPNDWPRQGADDYNFSRPFLDSSQHPIFNISIIMDMHDLVIVDSERVEGRGERDTYEVLFEPWSLYGSHLVFVGVSLGGKKGMALSHLRSVYATAKGLHQDIKLYLKTAQKSSKGRKNGNRLRGLISLRKHRAKPVYLCKLSRMSWICGIGKMKGTRVAKLICLKKENKKAMKDLHKVLPQDTWLPACNPVTSQDDWNNPLEDHYSGLVCRRTTCWGYDFMYPFAGILRGALQY